MKEVALYGLGLIGGSIALALRERMPHVRIVAIDREAVLAEARERNLADQLILPTNRGELDDAAARADVMVLACPVSVISAEVPALLRCCSVLTDCGSTKREIVAAAAGSPRRDRFVPGHPMAGGPRGGLTQARADLFESQSWLICPEGSCAAAHAVVSSLIRALGANVVELSAQQHDRSVARTSHVPQILASALAVLVDESQAEVAAGPAFRSATRSAGGEEAMWRDIFASNADEIAAALGELLGPLTAVQRELCAEPAKLEAVLSLLGHARAARRR